MLLTAAEVKALDARSVAAGTSIEELMGRAGRAVADRALAMTGEGGRILVLCGPGNNGGDGFATARYLRQDGRTVTVAASRAATAMSGAAAAAATAWDGETVALADADLSKADLVVDAIFGVGSSREVLADIAAVMDRVNGSGVPVLAVDIPSGIASDTGAVLGRAVRAIWTVTFVARKPGHLLRPGRSYAGHVEIADIGLGLDPFPGTEPAIMANGPKLWTSAFPRLRDDGHKYDRGHAVVLSGGPAHTGAARLAARGALRAGAGLVSVVTSARALSVNAAHLTAIMLRVADEPEELSDLLADERFNAILLGPALGIGEATRNWVSAVLDADRATVLDADALTSFAGRIDDLLRLIDENRTAPLLLTPHEGEFARLFDGPGEVNDEARRAARASSRIERAVLAAALTRVVVVLKGADTIVASPDGRIAIAENGSPHLATAGSGDVLGGIATGLMAQGMPGFEAAAAAVWMHADAATRFGPGLIAEDLPDGLPAVLRALGGG